MSVWQFRFPPNSDTLHKHCPNVITVMILTHWGRVTHRCSGNLTIIGSDDWWLVAWTAPSYYLNQCCNIVNWTLRNKLQSNFSWKSNIFIQENALENIICGMVSILSQPQWVKKTKMSGTTRHTLSYCWMCNITIWLIVFYIIWHHSYYGIFLH